MRFIIPVFITSFLVVACAGEENHSSDVESNEVDTTGQIMDTVAVDTVVEVEETPFSTFEHYMAIARRSELDSLFPGQITHEIVWYNEGTEERKISKLTNNETGHSVKYVWSMDDPNQVGDIEVNYHQYNEDFESIGEQDLASSTGVYLGMSFKDFREWNGAPFDFSGFGWDFGGGILTAQGKLKDCDFSIYMMQDPEADQEAFGQFVGDQIFSSDDEGLENPPFYISSFRYTAGEY